MFSRISNEMNIDTSVDIKSNSGVYLRLIVRVDLNPVKTVTVDAEAWNGGSNGNIGNASLGIRFACSIYPLR